MSDQFAMNDYSRLYDLFGPQDSRHPGILRPERELRDWDREHHSLARFNANVYRRLDAKRKSHHFGDFASLLELEVGVPTSFHPAWTSPATFATDATHRRNFPHLRKIL